MAVDILTTVECGNSWEHGTAHEPAVAFVRDQSFSRWWGARCSACLDRLDRLSRRDQPTRYEVVLIARTTVHVPGDDSAVPSRPGQADHDPAADDALD